MDLRQDREIYPNAPLEFVACEVRFPYAPGLAEEAVFARLHRSFYEWLPLAEPVIETTVLVGSAPIPTSSARQFRFLARDRRLLVSVGPTQVTVETTAYVRYEDFRTAIGRALRALVDAGAQVAGVSRIGLRYIDEIRVKGVATPAEWTGLIDERLLGPSGIRVSNNEIKSMQGTLHFGRGEGREVVMRYGATDGQSVGDAPLKRRPMEGPHYFLIDIDSFAALADPIPTFEPEAVLGISDDLHEPIRALFETSVTDRLRDEVLRRPLHAYA